MGYLLLWIEIVVVLGLWAALGNAIAARVRFAGLRFLLLTLWLLVLIAVIAIPVAGIGWIVIALLLPIYTKWLVYTISFAVVALAISVYLTYRGMKWKEDRPVAARWPVRWIAGAFLVALWLHFFTLSSMDTAMQNKLLQLRAESTAIALSVAPQRVPDDQNAALWYRRLGEQSRSDEKKPKDYQRWCDWLGDDRAQFDSSDPDLRDYLTSKRDAIALMHRAAEMPGCCFERDYAQLSVSTLLPEYGWMRDGNRLLALDTRIKAADENIGEAYRDAVAMFQMANHLKSEPFLIGQLVSIAVDGQATDTLEYLLATTDPEDTTLGNLPLEDPLRYSDGMTRAMYLEKAFGMSIFSSLGVDQEYSLMAISGTDSGFDTVPPLWIYWRIFLMPDDVRSYKQIMEQMQNYSIMPYYESSEERKKMNDREYFKDTGIMTHMIAPALSRCFEVSAKGDARRGLSQLAVACELYKIAKGEYPKTIEELTPAYLQIMPYDPFDGKPLKMIEADGGLVLYSIGPDEIDNKGQEMDDDKKGDITFCLGDAYAARRLKKDEPTRSPER